MFVTCFLIPVALLSRAQTRSVAGTVVASAAVIIGMWLERFTIVVPTLLNPRLPYPRVSYTPSWVEVSIMAACFAAFILLYMLFTKFFPIVSIWEIKEGQATAVEETSERIRSYLPEGQAVAVSD